MSLTLWECHRFSTSSEQWTSRLCVEDGVFYFHKRPVCVLEACDVTSVKIELDPFMDRQRDS